jgi:hypothetical protein
VRGREQPIEIHVGALQQAISIAYRPGAIGGEETKKVSRVFVFVAEASRQFSANRIFHKVFLFPGAPMGGTVSV